MTEWAGYNAQNQLLWTNQAGNFSPTANQAQPYRIYQYQPTGEVSRLEHRDSTQSGVLHDRYDWDGMRLLRRILCVGTTQERYTALYDGFGTRVASRINAVDHVYSFSRGLLHDTAGNTTYRR